MQERETSGSEVGEMTKDELLESPEVRELLSAMCLVRNTSEARAFLFDLCSLKEIEDLAQRLEVAHMLDAGESYLEVQKATGASSTTVSRVSKCLNGTEGGYRFLLDRERGEGSRR